MFTTRAGACISWKFKTRVDTEGHETSILVAKPCGLTPRAGLGYGLAFDRAIVLVEHIGGNHEEHSFLVDSNGVPRHHPVRMWVQYDPYA